MAHVNEIGIDLGTANVVIYRRNEGLVLQEPAVIAVDRDLRKVQGVGQEAWRMMCRAPGNIDVQRPIRDGVISDFDMTTAMLSYFVRRVCGKHLFGGPSVVISLPAGVNEMEQHGLTAALFEAGVRRTRMMEKPVAAALGSGISIGDPSGQLICDIGAGMADMAVTSMGRITVRNTTPLGGDRLDDAIIHYIRRKHNLLIGEITAEEVKRNLASALPRRERLFMEITGRNLITGLPRAMRVNSDEIAEAVEEPVMDLVDSIHSLLEHTPAELAGDIKSNGIMLTGGGALLPGLAEKISEEIRMDCHVAESPQNCVARGCLMALENRHEYSKYLVTRKNRM